MSGAKTGYINLGTMRCAADHGDLVNSFKADYKACVRQRRKTLLIKRLESGQLVNRLGIADLLQAFFLSKQNLFSGEANERTLQEAFARFLSSELGLEQAQVTSPVVVPQPAPAAPAAQPAPVAAVPDVAEPNVRSDAAKSVPAPPVNTTGAAASLPPIAMGIPRTKRPQKQ